MAFSGGVFSRLYSWATEQASPPLEIAKLDTQEEDFATGLSNCILRDGTGIPTAATPWNSQRITTLGAATARTDAIRASQVQDNSINVLSSVAGTNTITGSLTPAITAHAAGMMVVLTPANTNTGAVTLNVNSVGALDVLGTRGQALIGGELAAGIPALLLLDSGADDWILLNEQPASGSFTTTLSGVSGSVTGTLYWKKIDGIVSLWAVAAITGTSNSTSFGFDGIPASIAPADVKLLSTVFIDNNVNVPAFTSTGTGMNPSNLRTAGSYAWTSSGTKGIPSGWSVSYPLY